MDDLSAQLADMMREYTSEVEVAVSNAIEEAGKELLKDVKEKSRKVKMVETIKRDGV